MARETRSQAAARRKKGDKVSLTPLVTSTPRPGRILPEEAISETLEKEEENFGEEEVEGEAGPSWLRDEPSGQMEPGIVAHDEPEGGLAGTGSSDASGKCYGPYFYLMGLRHFRTTLANLSILYISTFHK
ncbi:hypothetical protein AGABI1DRAFT_130753 [Agaricus bisporus var. burnettii JB137-S8]|uniref:Uncharacterized protein n=1 Tax=Agaricus bisporus var. burnettii (strain JB137-S8 / ATCC MYA-4627 / FGSC 10392) TaxID=597362 RepID=K5X290_AGABU|nr:uncharacterized protein AGABI1DRAFT_130753 [Agaricus bisporus var. burnettii JB137-S8]EKM77027.1 hypothetical protein AGABI1DRAFT_130753 [Agaricus bisporus var. burnettii JB137-S8]